MLKIIKYIIVFSICLICLSACGKHINSTPHSQNEIHFQDPFDQSGISLQQYNKIKYSNDQLKGGNTKKDIIGLLGKSYKTNDVKLTNGQTAKQYSWFMGNKAQIQYIIAIMYNNKVLSKGFFQNEKSINVAKNKINNIKQNDSYSKVIKSLDLPWKEELSDKYKTLIYKSENATHQYILTFENNILKSKKTININSEK
jgi:hypothetical protein